MWCEAQFATFNERLKLDPTRHQRIEAAVARFGAFCLADDQLKAARGADPFFQGSVASRTVIRPVLNDEFDVDVVFPFRLTAFKPEDQTAGRIFPWFVSRLEKSDFYRERMVRKNRCVRIRYAGDFHVDIIPSTTDVPAHQPFAVPARDLHDWITSDPRGFDQWINLVDQNSGLTDASSDGVFRRCVRYLKRWRDVEFGESVSSVLLVTVLGKHEASVPTRYNPTLADPLYPTFKKDAAYLYDLLRLTCSCIGQPDHGAFLHPTIAQEDLAAGWTGEQLAQFSLKLQECRNQVGAAIEARSEEEAIRLFRSAFSGFPD